MFEAKEYKLSYVQKNPPKFVEPGLEDFWKQAVSEYLSRQGISEPDKVKVIKNVEWNEVTRIYNTLIGKKNRKRPDDHVRGQKNNELETDKGRGKYMPAGMVKNKRDEKMWKQAKRYVKKSTGERWSKNFSDQDWGLVTNIFKKMKEKYKGKKLPKKYTKESIEESAEELMDTLQYFQEGK